MNTLTKYREHRANLKTGDIVLFSGNGPISSLIKLASRSRWSHVGVVLVLEGNVMLYESTTLSKIAASGVALVPLSHRIRSYDGSQIAVRSLEKARLVKKHIQALFDLRQRLDGRPYEADKLELVRAVLGDSLLGNREEDLSSVFCSELVWEVLQALEIAPESRPSNTLMPAHYAESLRLRRGVYGPLVDLL